MREQIAIFGIGVAGLVAIAYLDRPQEPPQVQTHAPVVIRLDLTPEAMAACKEAFIRYGFEGVRQYECRLEKGDGGLEVALYGPDYNDPTYVRNGGEPPVRRLGAVPLGGEE